MPILTEQLARCVRKSGREAEGTPLLRVQARKTGFGGSNPPFSAKTLSHAVSNSMGFFVSVVIVPFLPVTNFGLPLRRLLFFALLV